ncbi:MAG: hypothetical protein KDD55_07760 [Bdellovibrionales bacterium]|nr:hypothetical protein [Bdellovibrionales bacterium]
MLRRRIADLAGHDFPSLRNHLREKVLVEHVLETH